MKDGISALPQRFDMLEPGAYFDWCGATLKKTDAGCANHTNGQRVPFDGHEMVCQMTPEFARQPRPPQVPEPLSKREHMRKVLSRLNVGDTVGVLLHVGVLLDGCVQDSDDTNVLVLNRVRQGMRCEVHVDVIELIYESETKK